MRLELAVIALVLAGCSGAQQPQGVARNLTIGTEQCSRYKWGTSQMAECLDRAASQSAIMSQTPQGGNG